MGLNLGNKINLGRGKAVLVDPEMYEYLSQWKWRCSSTGYATRSVHIKGTKNKSTTVLMHRLINATPEGLFTDHINGNTLDNRKSNLRSCSHQENMMNRKTRSPHKGVVWHKRDKRWQASIQKNNRSYHLGQFRSLKEAVQAYKNKSKELFGEFSNA